MIRWLGRLLSRFGSKHEELVEWRVDLPAAPVITPRPPPPPPPKIVATPNEVFTPTRPRAGQRALVGRKAELDRILEAIREESAHVVLYAERGRGKTSLANLAVEGLKRRGAIVARCVCEAETTFDGMIRALARDLPRSLLPRNVLRADSDGCEGMLPERSLRPADVAAIPTLLDFPLVVFVVDEFDRVLDAETRTRLADTIKLLSDREAKLYFIVVGVSDTLEQIIGQHPSIQRNIVAIHLPLLTDEEIGAMLTRGGEQAGIVFGERAIQLVVSVARGMPYMAQLLGLRIAQSALRDGREQVEDSDLVASVKRLLDEASASVSSTYTSLVGPGMDSPMVGVMNRVCSAEQDRWGRMSVAVMPNQVLVGGQRVGPKAWARLLSTGTLLQTGGENGSARFADRALMYHVQLLAAQAWLKSDRPTAALSDTEAGEL